MTTRQPQPSNLPPNPSVGELVTEIDRARHDVAVTLTALVDKVDVRARVSERREVVGVQHAVARLRARRDRVAGVTPEPVARTLGMMVRYAQRTPVSVRIGLIVFALGWWRARRHG